MSPSARKPRVVAELGRPETPHETAERKAEASANHRKRQTVNNLVLSLLATVAVVVVIVLLVPRGETNLVSPVDYRQVAADAGNPEPGPLAAPSLPDGWSANKAQLRTKTSDGLDIWEIGFITPEHEYIGLLQGFDANSTWVAEQVAKTPPEGASVIDGVRWTVYDNRGTSRDVGNAEYALVADGEHSTIVLLGTAEVEEFRELARALTPYLVTNGEPE